MAARLNIGPYYSWGRRNKQEEQRTGRPCELEALIGASISIRPRYRKEFIFRIYTKNFISNQIFLKIVIFIV
jgi:hypothetical protein